MKMEKNKKITRYWARLSLQFLSATISNSSEMKQFRFTARRDCCLAPPQNMMRLQCVGFTPTRIQMDGLVSPRSVNLLLFQNKFINLFLLSLGVASQFICTSFRFVDFNLFFRFFLLDMKVTKI